MSTNLIFDEINIFILISLFINAVLFLILILSTFKNKSNIYFVFFCVGVLLWHVAMLLFRSGVTVGDKLFWSKALYVTAAVIPAAFVIFCNYFLFKTKHQNLITVATAVGQIGIIILVLMGDSVITNIVIGQKGYLFQEAKIEWGPLYLLYVLYQNIFFILGFILLYIKYRIAVKEDKAKIQYVIIGTLLSVSIAFVTNLFLPTIGIFDLNWVGQVSTIFWVGFTAYAITVHRLFDITFAIRQIVISVIVSIGTFLIGIIIYRFDGLLVNRAVEARLVVLLFLGSYIVTLAIPVIQEYVTEFVDNRLFKRYVNKDKALSLLSDVIRDEIDIKAIMDRVVETVRNALGVQYAEVVLLDNTDQANEKRGSMFSNDDSVTKAGFDKEEYINYLVQNNFPKVILVREITKDKTISFFSARKIEVVINIFNEKDIFGLVLVGEKNSNDAFSRNDIELLSALSIQISAAIVKASYFYAEQQYSKRLNHEIEEATAVLKQQKSQLQEKYQFEKDMMGIMGHELRTPMTVAKGMAELVMAKAQTAGAVEKEYLMDKLEKIFTSVVKESDLIQTMLSTSHIDNNKMNFQFTKFDIVELINYSMMAFKKEAEFKGLKLDFREPDFKVPEIVSDQSRIQEIVTNLISNAVKYTNTGSIDVTLTKEGDFLHYAVKDTGIGIPESELQNIGKKFYRIHQHLDQKKDVVRAGGTGLGLYVVKGLLTALGGELLVDSKEGVGSVFTAVIPIESKQTDLSIVSDKPIDQNDMFQKLGLDKA